MAKNKQNISFFAIWAAIIAVAFHSYRTRSLMGASTVKLKTARNATESLKTTSEIPLYPSIAPAPKLRILSYDPFIAHIENFLTENERKYLISYSKPLLTRSTVLHPNGSQSESFERTSSTAYLPQNDMTVTSILERASEFQGYIPLQRLDMQVTAYQTGQEYRPHYDWFMQENLTENRLSTFFAILDAECENCGTQFPNIPVNWADKDPRLCQFVDCSQSLFTSKPMIGSAIYWRNLDEHGRGRHDAMHAGLPLPSGRKIGLNIWTSVPVKPSTT